ncbi:hypothetical protein GY12_11410 [Micrococcus luteus]|nr:hypothetical protein GY12_11410 [Micrococcus luteus]
MALTWPSSTAGPTCPGLGEFAYQAAGEPGSAGGTASEPSSRRSRRIRSEPAPIEGIVKDTGGESSRPSATTASCARRSSSATRAASSAAAACAAAASASA